MDGRQCIIQDSFWMVCIRSLFRLWFWRNKGTYVHQVALEMSFLTKDSHDVRSKLTMFLLTVLLKNIVCDKDGI